MHIYLSTAVYVAYLFLAKCKNICYVHFLGILNKSAMQMRYRYLLRIKYIWKIVFVNQTSGNVNARPHTDVRHEWQDSNKTFLNCTIDGAASVRT